MITAARMLDFMICSLHPIRAEVSNIANAVYDGTSCMMFSGETEGNPIEALRIMAGFVAGARLFYCLLLCNAVVVPGQFIVARQTAVCLYDKLMLRKLLLRKRQISWCLAQEYKMRENTIAFPLQDIQEAIRGAIVDALARGTC